MRKIFFPADRPAEVIDAPLPVPGPGQLLVCTEAVGVSVGLVRMLAAGEAVRPGGEMVGTVVAAGPEVAGFEIGDRVGGVVFEDVYADIVLADPRLVSHVPAEVDATAALALVRGGLIALSTLRAGYLASGESVLVTAAASGTGHLAVQLAKTLGAARVVAAVGSAGKAGFVRQCGADEVVTYTQPSWGDPVDLVLDGVGGELVQRGVDALTPFGRLVAFSAGGGTELWDLLAARWLNPKSVSLPLEEITKAIDLVATRSNLGRSSASSKRCSAPRSPRSIRPTEPQSSGPS